jgi:hypothetical protein
VQLTYCCTPPPSRRAPPSKRAACNPSNPFAEYERLFVWRACAAKKRNGGFSPLGRKNDKNTSRPKKTSWGRGRGGLTVYVNELVDQDLVDLRLTRQSVRAEDDPQLLRPADERPRSRLRAGVGPALRALDGYGRDRFRDRRGGRRQDTPRPAVDVVRRRDDDRRYRLRIAPTPRPPGMHRPSAGRRVCIVQANKHPPSAVHQFVHPAAATTPVLLPDSVVVPTHRAAAAVVPPRDAAANGVRYHAQCPEEGRGTRSRRVERAGEVQ